MHLDILQKQVKSLVVEGELYGVSNDRDTQTGEIVISSVSPSVSLLFTSGAQWSETLLTTYAPRLISSFGSSLSPMATRHPP